MPEFVHYEVNDRVAVLTIDNPPVNALAPASGKRSTRRVARANGDPAADAIVLIGAGTTFIAGADINIFKTAEDAASTRWRDRRARTRCCGGSRTATKPLVAAIHGNALGGGLEVAMACHYRVADEGREGRPARSAARHHPRRRRHAAAAAAGRRDARARDVHRRQAGRGAEGARPPASSTRSSRATC